MRGFLAEAMLGVCVLITGCSEAEFNATQEPEVYRDYGQSQVVDLVVVPTEEYRFGNRLYRMDVMRGGVSEGSFLLISGRSWAQDRDTNIPDVGAPLPAGEYLVGELEFVEEPKELGGIWVGLSPMFGTRRTYLGLHYDPSFGKDNGESGTEGCLAVVSEGDRDRFTAMVVGLRPERLVVLN